MTIKVSRENPQDAICIELVRELSAELGPLYGTDGSALFTPDDVNIPRAGFVVAWLDDEAVGCGALRPMENESVAEIKRMYVRQSARGKGVSRHILARLEALATEFEYASVILETGIYQQAAIGLYESSGYQRVTCYAPYDNSEHSLCYEKKL